MTCPFCYPSPENVLYSGDDFLCIWDSYPVSDGHGLVVPCRHIASWFDATKAEQVSLLEGVEILRQQIEKQHSPDGFNIGINIGGAAGQTVPHLHIHVIPRYEGDVYDPRGGVRYVIPEKANYLEPKKAIEDSAAQSADSFQRSVFGNEEFPLIDSLSQDITEATQFDVAVAFVTESGLNQVQAFVLDLMRRHGSLRFLTGDYMDVTEPRALLRLLDWMQEYAQLVEVRVFQTDHELGFHPKAYLIHKDQSVAIAYVGSSNLTKHALTRGLEWNQRIEGALYEGPLMQTKTEFERLFSHPKTVALSQTWIDEYQQRRQVASSAMKAEGVNPDIELPEQVPTPNEIQQEVLTALDRSRKDRNKAGLVVMATGLGKTWLAAFDSEGFEKVLFVAHREEILEQAQETFRKIRPGASFGRYGGGEYNKSAHVLFASIQTLGRKNHLSNFHPNHFDYIVVDEFHHAAASTYRRLIDYFDPNFLLGLTATPERTDGGDLLGLCGENLVYRCDLFAGINQELLSPFHYFGVPDDTDFANIPWRSGRFDPEKLEFEVATEKRARNVFEQWEKRGQTKTLAFCVSKRHADFMTEFFLSRGAKAVAVHSGPSSAPRTQSLDRLENGELEIVFAVDMFNEGVDVPAIDTVMMLRPTESKILWLQQLGRGLRKSDGKAHLNVIDYIGNHRTFLQVPMLLLPGAGTQVGEVSRALEALEKGELELPLGCSIEYELEALNILKQLARPTATADQITHWFRSFRELHGRRPLASEAWREGYDPKKIRTTFGSWFGFIKAENELTEAEEEAFGSNQAFFKSLEVTPMSKSFKMLTLLAMIAGGKFPGEIPIKELSTQVKRIASRIHLLSKEFEGAINSEGTMRKLLVRNPIDAWVNGRGMGDIEYFSYEDGLFRSNRIAAIDNEVIAGLTQEICDYRLAQYLDRLHGESKFARTIVCNVSHSSGTPMLFLPGRDTLPGIPEGWSLVTVNGEQYQANFVKVAVNVMKKEGNEANVLPGVLRSFFGEAAGRPGEAQQVRFEMMDGTYELKPMGTAVVGPQLWNEYMRAEIPPLFGMEFSSQRWERGIVSVEDTTFLLVTLNKKGKADEHQYADTFVSNEQLSWVSQNQMKRANPSSQKLLHHEKESRQVFLFVRGQGKTPQGKAAPFVFCGNVKFVEWEGDNPITVQWRLENPLPDTIFDLFDHSQK